MIFSNENINFNNEPLFLGKGRNVARLDLNNEQWIQKWTEKQDGQMWFKTDFTYTQDAIDYSEFSDDRKNFFNKNLKFQTLVDSIATRTALEVFAPITTNPQLEEWWVTHGNMERIHSSSYAELIKALPINANAVFDDIMVNENILSRARMIINVFNDTADYNAVYSLSNSATIASELSYDEDEHKKLIVKSLYALNILENVMFQTSFVCSFGFGENSVLESSAKTVSKISQDETLHFTMTVYLINKLKKDNDWAHIVKQVEPEVLEMYKNVYEMDSLWIDYLYETDPKLVGLTSKVLKAFSLYNIDKTMQSLGLVKMSDLLNIEQIKLHPCSWVNKYNNLSNVQTAMNESDGTNYLLSIVDKTMTNSDWENLL